MKNAIIICLMLSCLIHGATCLVSQAADYPIKAIELVVPFAPGGSTDAMSRIVNIKLPEILGQPVVITNKPGAGSVIGIEIVAQAKPDGYTLLASGINLVIAKAINSKVTYDPVQDFTPIVNLVYQAAFLCVNSSSKITSLAQYVENAKRNPGKVAFGSPGTGTSAHFSGELFKKYAKIDITHVPYKGNGPSNIALLGGHIDSLFADASAVEQVKAGKFRALAVATPKRLPELPDVPTIAESGYPGDEVVAWLGVLAPAKVPPVIVEKLSLSCKKALEDPEVANKLKSIGFIIAYMDPEKFRAYVKSEYEKYSGLAKEANIKVE